MSSFNYQNISSTAFQLRCTSCGDLHNIDSRHRTCSCGKVLFVDYDLEKAKETLDKESIQFRRRYNIWRLAEIMPVFEEKYRFSLGEGWTPLVKLNNIGDKLNLKNLYLKDESFNPTGSFKSRGLCAAVSRAVELGIRDFVIPTAGNAGAALAAYAAKSKSNAHIFMPEDTPPFIVTETKALGADTHLVKGLITDAGKIAKEKGLENKWFDVSTLKEPYRAEGKKTMGLELAEQFDWSLPDVIVYPTGGGTGIVGMWKSFNELEELGLIDDKRPKMITVQSSTCAPIVKAFEEGKKHAEFWENAETIAAGLRVPVAIADYLILDALRKSGGTAVAVDDLTIKIAMSQLAKEEGIMLSAEGAATIAALELLLENGSIEEDETVVAFGTGSGLTTPEAW